MTCAMKLDKKSVFSIYICYIFWQKRLHSPRHTVYLTYITLIMNIIFNVAHWSSSGGAGSLYPTWPEARLLTDDSTQCVIINTGHKRKRETRLDLQSL